MILCDGMRKADGRVEFVSAAMSPIREDFVPGRRTRVHDGRDCSSKKKKRVNILHPNLVPKQTVSLHAFEDIVKSKSLPLC